MTNPNYDFLAKPGAVLKLFHGTVLMGTIGEIYTDQPEYGGTIALTADGESYREYFAHMVDEEKQSEEWPFDESILDNWFIEDEHGQRFEASCPGVYDDLDILWRMWPLGSLEAINDEV